MLFELFDRLIDAESPNATRKWRSTVGYLLLAIFFATTFLATAATTGVPMLGKLAWANEVDKKTQDVIAPLASKLLEIAGAVEQQSKTSKALLAKITADQIDQLVKRRCRSAVSDEIEYLSKEIRRLGDEYLDLQGRDYRLLTCDEIAYKEKVR